MIHIYQLLINVFQMVSYPDDSMQDPAKPKNSAVVWKTSSEWGNNDEMLPLHNFSASNSDTSKYVCEDSKTSMEDGNMNDENCLMKEERDSNFNMESSNSSESCHSMKETSIKELEVAPSSTSSGAATSVNSTSLAQHRSSSHVRHKGKSGKESSRYFFLTCYYFT